MLLSADRSCCPKFETGQNFEPTTPNISFAPRSLKCSATMFALFAQVFQHGWGHARALRTQRMVSLVFTKSYGLYPFQDALKVLTSLDVVACVCTPLHERNKSE